MHTHLLNFDCMFYVIKEPKNIQIILFSTGDTLPFLLIGKSLIWFEA